MAARCSCCNKPCVDGNLITHSQCKHSTHTLCLMAAHNQDMDAIDFDRCPACNGKGGREGGGGGGSQTPVAEPRVGDGRDYILHPGPRDPHGTGGSAASLGSSLMGLFSRTPAAAPKGDRAPAAWSLLCERLSIEQLAASDVGLEHILRDGGDIEDFLSNGYTLDDLAKFEDIGHKGARRCRQALRALQLNANDLLRYSHALPLAKVARLMDQGVDACVAGLGLAFVDNGHGPLMHQEQPWSLQDCADIGLSFADLRRMGLRWREQWNDLVYDMAPAQVADAMGKLSIGQDAVSALPTLARERAPPPPPPQAPLWVGEEEEEEMQAVSAPAPTPSVPPPRRAARRPAKGPTAQPTGDRSDFVRLRDLHGFKG